MRSHAYARGADARREARTLLAELTLEEKLWLLDGDIRFWPGTIDLGHGGYHEHAWPAAKLERLGIPGLDFADGPRGCVVGACTAFPVSMARGASFDPELERRVGRAIGVELRASGATFTGAVCLNLLRHPAWGRAQETYGEDPHHVGEMAAALTDGLQEHVMACMKHFALNSMENARFSVDVTVDERALHEVYLPHFKRVAEAGVASVMSAYNSVNGEWCGENEVLLTDILRNEWGFEGFVITDFTFGLRDSVKSVVAGCNIEMPFRQQRAIALPQAVADGTLPLAAIDARVAESLATFLRFAHVYEHQPAPDVIACAEHRALAREAASASMVLLRNEAELLPLAAEALTKVAVLGRLADRPNLGDGGSSDVPQPDVVTLLGGLTSALPGAEVEHSDSDVSIVEGADLVVVVVGYTAEDEGESIDPSALAALAHLFPPVDHPETGFEPGEARSRQGAGRNRTPTFASGGDRDSLRLQPEDEALIRAAAARHGRVVVAVIAGSAVAMPWLDAVSAALMLWYPGMEGGHAFADVLLGAAEPGGRLPFAVPHDEADLVPFDKNASRASYGLLHGQWWLDRHAVAAQLPFGFGLGYTQFEIAEASESENEVCVRVRNAGERSGSTVVQVYASIAESAFERPPQRLVGFARVRLDAGEARHVAIRPRLSLLDVRSGGRWVREEQRVSYSVGFDASRRLPVHTRKDDDGSAPGLAH